MGVVLPRMITGLADAQLTVPVVPNAEAATVHSVSVATPLAVLQRKNDTANHAAEIVPTLLAPSRVKVMLDPDAPLDPLRVPVSATSPSRPVEPGSPAELAKTRAVRVVSTVVMLVVLVVPVPVRVDVPLCTALPSLS